MQFVKQREMLKKYQIHLGVLGLFVLTVAFVCVGWHYHIKNKKEKMISQRIFFEAEKRNLNLADPAKNDDVAGSLGLSLPRWQLPKHCTQDSDDQEYQCLKWKSNAKLRIAYFEKPATQCYNISWESLNSHFFHRDCFDLGSAAWYGPSNVSSSTWTNRGINFTFSSSFTYEFDAGDYALATENYWLSSTGVGIFIPGDIPLVIDWNGSRKGWVCFTSNYTGDFYGNKITHRKHYLNYTICNGNDVRATHAYMRTLLPDPPTELPAAYTYRSPMWSTLDVMNDSKVTEKDVLQKALQISKWNLSCSSIIIDKTWQSIYGEFSFDVERFPNVTSLLEDIRESSGCSLTLTFTPYFDYMSKSFAEGHPEKAFIQDASGRVPTLMTWDKKVVAMVDVTNPRAVSWLKGKITALTSREHFTSFMLEYSSPNWIPYHPTFDNRDATPTAVRKLVSEMVSSFSNDRADILGGTAHTQYLPAYIGIKTHIVATKTGECLSGTIPSALTLGIMGYPYVMADGLYSSDDIPRDLYIRWLQLASFFPAMKISIPPWLYDSDVVEVAQNMSKIHNQYVSERIEDMKQEIFKGDPIIRPIWWNAPSDSKAMMIEDQFLIGNDVMVAPVLCQGKTSRRIYFPQGLWSVRDGDNFITGNTWVDFNVRLYEVPIFIKKKVIGKAAYINQR